MNLLIALLAGATVGGLLVVAALPLFSGGSLDTVNHRGRTLPAGLGVLLPMAALTADLVFVVVDRTGHHIARGDDRLLVLLGVVPFALLGFFDDARGSAAGAPKGFRGHVRALAEGRLTTGALKLTGGGVAALVLGAAVHPSGWLDWLADALLIALAANTANLFDRAPGRCTKVCMLAWAGLAAAAGTAGRADSLLGTTLVVGAGLGSLWGDLRERFMLGDAGANALGAGLGLGAVLSLGQGARLGVLAALVVLNAAAEAVSFSQVIDAVPPLRWLDRLGRPAPADRR